MVKKPMAKKPARPPVPPPTARQLADAFLTSSIMDVSGWHSIVAVSLNFKLQLRSDHGSMTVLTEDICRQQLLGFGVALDRLVYGNAARRYGKRVRRVVVLENGEDRVWHAHLAMEKPPTMADVKFRKLVMEAWDKCPWSGRQEDIQLDADEGWMDYLGKIRSKREFISWSDCVVVEACFNDAK
jgi:hypothetical protein